MKKITILAITSFALLIFGVFVFSLFSGSPKKQTISIPKASLSPSPTIITTQPESTALTAAPVPYNSTASSELVQKINNHPALITLDQQLKSQLLDSISRKSAILTTNSNYQIEYVSSFDLFQVEIRTINVSSAKELATDWFRQKGFSDQGICDLPVMFYLNLATTQNLSGQSVEVNPLPEGCQ